jgi:hypothetical protein
MGAELGPARDRSLTADVRAGGAIDYVELVRNGAPLARRDSPTRPGGSGPEFRGKVTIGVGWGEAGRATDWNVSFGVKNGRVVAVEPRFRGDEVVSPREDAGATHHFSRWKPSGDSTVEFQTRTSPNPNTRTDGTQKLCLEIEGDGDTRLVAQVNGQDVSLPLAELRRGPRAGYLDGFVSEAWQISRAVPESEYAWSVGWSDRAEGEADDSYYHVRVRQKNDQWAWSSPIWVGGPTRAGRGG